MNNERKYWTEQYQENRTGWDIGYPSTPIKEYIDQLTDKNISILIPGAGNAYEAEYLWQKEFKNVHVMDISEIPLEKFKDRNPKFPKNQLLLENFFENKKQYDLILEQTFFCSFVPTDVNRNLYAQQMANLLKTSGKLVGVWFNIPLSGDMEKRPFGGTKKQYLNHLKPYFETLTFTECHNSVPPRADSELFGIFIKK
ncbi:SAM-dependent methyltransferase [Zobellia amurskyensis]|uniref:SAM-dependent methyltransferase n=1 Tax=Zobellia amurskyensis TaxID=248905 RepID=A0A7X2ZTI4_9FLAO|nr:SAM-dependent methyltransferase [Zobellia amurskyensis]MUH36132.1 SAM-dependent methyltransferase [Zobellia amurskyensis]